MTDSHQNARSLLPGTTTPDEALGQALPRKRWSGPGIKFKPKICSVVDGGTLISLVYDLATDRLSVHRHEGYVLVDYSPGIFANPRSLRFAASPTMPHKVIKIERLGQVELRRTKTGLCLRIFTVNDRYTMDLATMWKNVSRHLLKRNAANVQLATSYMILRRRPA